MHERANFKAAKALISDTGPNKESFFRPFFSNSPLARGSKTPTTHFFPMGENRLHLQ